MLAHLLDAGHLIHDVGEDVDQQQLDDHDAGADDQGQDGVVEQEHTDNEHEGAAGGGVDTGDDGGGEHQGNEADGTGQGDHAALDVLTVAQGSQGSGVTGDDGQGGAGSQQAAHDGQQEPVLADTLQLGGEDLGQGSVGSALALDLSGEDQHHDDADQHGHTVSIQGEGTVADGEGAELLEQEPGNDGDDAGDGALAEAVLVSNSDSGEDGEGDGHVDGDGTQVIQEVVGQQAEQLDDELQADQQQQAVDTADDTGGDQAQLGVGAPGADDVGGQQQAVDQDDGGSDGGGQTEADDQTKADGEGHGTQLLAGDLAVIVLGDDGAEAVIEDSDTTVSQHGSQGTDGDNNDILQNIHELSCSLSLFCFIFWVFAYFSRMAFSRTGRTCSACWAVKP